MTGPITVLPGIAAKTLDWGFAWESVYSRHDGTSCPKPSSSSGRVWNIVLDDTRCASQASSLGFENWILSDNASKLKMFSCKLFPDAISGGDTESCTSCDFTLVKKLLFTDLSLSRHFSSSVKPKSFTPIRHCSVDTELIYRMNNSAQEFCVRWISIEMYGFFTPLPFQDSTTQSTDAFEHGMTGFFESLCHSIGCGVPLSTGRVRGLSIPLLFRSRTQKRPVSLQESHRVILDFFLHSKYKISSCPLFDQSMSLNIDMKMIRSVNS